MMQQITGTATTGHLDNVWRLSIVVGIFAQDFKKKKEVIELSNVLLLHRPNT